MEQIKEMFGFLHILIFPSLVSLYSLNVNRFGRALILNFIPDPQVDSQIDP